MGELNMSPPARNPGTGVHVGGPELSRAVEILAAQQAFIVFERSPFHEPGENEPMDDLRKCIEHRIPVNRCLVCLPGWLKYLGGLCAQFRQRQIHGQLKHAGGNS